MGGGAIAVRGEGKPADGACGACNIFRRAGLAVLAARAAAENPDAGAAAARMLGRAVPGANQLPGVRGTDLQGLPKTSVLVDGSKAFVTLELAVRWPASVPEVTEQVRRHVRDRVRELAGLEVDEVHIVVADLAVDIPPPPRVR